MKELLSGTDAARELRVARRTVIYYSNHNALPYVATRLGRLYRPADVAALKTVLDARTRRGPAPTTRGR